MPNEQVDRVLREENNKSLCHVTFVAIDEYKRAADTRRNEVEIGLGSRVVGCHTNY